MLVRTLTVVAVSLGAATGCSEQAEVHSELYLAYWNVENLFDTADDPSVAGDEEFTPTSPKAWTEERLAIKTSNLSRVITDMNDGRGPDILGQCEIENRAVVELLVASLASLQRDYGIIHRDSPSGRGIDCAIVYDRDRIALRSHDFLHVAAGNTRDIVESEFAVGSHHFFVFANHWPSRGNPESHRIIAATTLRGRIDQLLATDGAADIVVLGDLNDEPTDASVRQYLKASGNLASLEPGTFYNSVWPIHVDPDAGTYVFENRWEVIDHVIFSPGLLQPDGLRWLSGATEVIRNDYQIYVPSDVNSIPRPSRSYTGDNFHVNGYSDHLPVVSALVY
jgi:predicted extracellular nuclease